MALYFSPDELRLLAESARAFGLSPDAMDRAIRLELEYQAKGRRQGFFGQLAEVVASACGDASSEDAES